jgi:hypothetical protein
LQAQLSAEHARQEASSAQCQLATAKQQLRQAAAAAAKPLAMSGWEDLIEEAAADLEGLEGRVTAAAQRLVELQVRGVLKPGCSLLFCCMLLCLWHCSCALVQPN